MDSGAEVSIIDSTYARKVGTTIDTKKTLDCQGVGGELFKTDGLAKVKITLAGELAYEFSLWVGRLDNTELILGTDFMTPAGVRLDLADGSACMPNKVRLRFEDRR